MLACGGNGRGPGGQRDARCSGGSDQMMSEMSLSGRDSIGQEGAQSSRNGRVKRAVRISSIVAQEVSQPLFKQCAQLVTKFSMNMFVFIIVCTLDAYFLKGLITVYMRVQGN